MHFQMIHRSYLLRGSTNPPDDVQSHVQDTAWKYESKSFSDCTTFLKTNPPITIRLNGQDYFRDRTTIYLQDIIGNFILLLKRCLQKRRIGNKLKSLITTTFNIGRLAVQSSRSRRKTRVVPVSHFFYFIITSKSKECSNSCTNTFPFSASFQ